MLPYLCRSLSVLQGLIVKAKQKIKALLVTYVSALATSVNKRVFYSVPGARVEKPAYFFSRLTQWNRN